MKHSRFLTLLLPTLVALLISAPSASAFTLRWDQIGWNDTLNTPQTFSNVDGSGIDVTVTLSGSFYNNDTPNVYTAATAANTTYSAQTGDLQIISSSSFFQPIRITVEFSEEVYVTDTTVRGMTHGTQSSTEWADFTVICGFDDQDNLLIADTYTTAGNAVTTHDSDLNDGIYKQSADPNSADTFGQATTSFTSQGVDRFWYDYKVIDHSDGGVVNPAIESEYAIAPIEFSAVPEPSAGILLMVGGLFLLLRRPIRQVS